MELLTAEVFSAVTVEDLPALSWKALPMRVPMPMAFAMPLLARGAFDSTRLDVLELVSPEMGCVYDYKTGKAGLTTARILKIVEAWNHRFPGVPVVIIEMRQGLPVWSE